MSTNHRDSHLDRQLDDLLGTILAGKETAPTDPGEQQFVQKLTEQAQAVHLDSAFSARLKAQLAGQNRPQPQLHELQRSPLPRAEGQTVRRLPLAALAAAVVVVLFAGVLFSLSGRKPGFPGSVPTTSASGTNVRMTPTPQPEGTTDPAIARPNERLWLLAHSPNGKAFAVGGCSQPAGANCLGGKVELKSLDGKIAGRSLVLGTVVTDIAIRHDGQVLAASGCARQGDDGRCIEGQIWLVNIPTGAVEDQTGTGSAMALRVTYQDEKVIGLSQDGNLWVWEPMAHRLTKQSFVDYQTFLTNTAFSRDGRFLAFENTQHAVYVWDLVSNKYVGQTVSSQTENIRSMALSPDGHLLAVAGQDHTIRFWDMTVGRLLEDRPLVGHTDTVVTMTFSPDGSRLASASADGSIRLWDVPTGKELGDPLRSGESETDLRLVFSSDGKQLISSSLTTVRRWDLTRIPVQSELLSTQNGK